MKHIGSLILSWHSWIARFALQLPWLLCASIYFAALNSGQGQTALEVPVERPLAGLFLAGILIGICVFFARRSSIDHPEFVTTLAIKQIPNLLQFPPRYYIELCESVGQPIVPKRTGRWPLLACAIVLCGIFSAGLLTVASVSHLAGPGTLVFGAGLIIGGIAVPYMLMACILAIRWVAARFLTESHVRTITSFLVSALPALLALAIYAIGIHAVIYRISDVVALGPHAIIALGLLTMTVLLQGVIYFLMSRATLRLGLLLAAIGVLVYMVQNPLAERANPLLVSVPHLVRASGTCARLSAGQTATLASTLDRVSFRNGTARPSILISSEGGGIRAAYWTALSLEELSEARSTPLLSDTEIISGVSGGSLGIATFIAAQELPRDARLPCIREFLSSDFMSPLLAGLFFLDIPRLILPQWLVDTHRGDYFERFIARRWLTLTGKDYFYRPLEKASGNGERRPAVYFNSTDAFSGQYVALRSQSAGHEHGDQLKLSVLNEAILKQLPDLRIAQAVHMSARFPLFSPTPDLRVPADVASRVLFGQTVAAKDVVKKVSLASLVDGGYFDNSGLWPALHLLDGDRELNSPPQRFVIHIINDQMRDCTDGSLNTGCVKAETALLKDRVKDRGGWLLRPVQAITAVPSQHSLQSLTELSLALPPLRGKDFLWKVPMPPAREAPWIVALLLDMGRWLPLHGRDHRYGTVELEWTLAPADREFLCKEAASIRMTRVPGINASAPTDRSKECVSQ